MLTIETTRDQCRWCVGGVHVIANRDGILCVIVEWETLVTALLLALIALVLVVMARYGLDDEADLVAHAEWMRQLKEEGAWVMW